MIFEEGNEDMDSKKKDLESDLCVFGVTRVCVHTIRTKTLFFPEGLSDKTVIEADSAMSYIVITFVFMVPA